VYWRKSKANNYDYTSIINNLKSRSEKVDQREKRERERERREERRNLRN